MLPRFHFLSPGHWRTDPAWRSSWQARGCRDPHADPGPGLQETLKTHPWAKQIWLNEVQLFCALTCQLINVPSLPYHLVHKKRSLDKMSTQGFLLLLFSHPVVSHSLWPHGLQHTRLPHPPLSPRVCSNSRPLSQWCHPTISSSVAPFSSGPQFFPASRSFSMSRPFASGGQSIGALALVLPMNIQGWFL